MGYSKLEKKNDSINIQDGKKISVKYGFITIGMAGTAIANTFADICTDIKNK